MDVRSIVGVFYIEFHFEDRLQAAGCTSRILQVSFGYVLVHVAQSDIAFTEQEHSKLLRIDVRIFCVITSPNFVLLTVTWS